MERRGNKLVVVGQKIVRGNNTRESFLDRVTRDNQLQSFFTKVVSGQQENPVFERNVIFIGTPNLSGVPGRKGLATEAIPELRETSVRRGRRGYYRRVNRRVEPPRLYANTVNKSIPREPAIKFGFGPHKIAFAMFYKESKTLVCSDLNTMDPNHACYFFNSVMTHLHSNNLIEPVPQPDPEEALESQATVMRKIIEIHDGQKVVFEVPKKQVITTVGCDPEFEYVDSNDQPIRAPEQYRGVGATIPIGVDGAGAQIELRPKESTNPKDVIETLKKLFQKIRNENPSAKLSVKGDRWPLGGHIHVGVGGSYHPHSDLVFLLDHFVGKKIIDLSGTARQNYRNLGAVREQPWGFEYRTPPAAVFQWPEFARLAMKAVQNLTEKFINGLRMVFNENLQFEDYWNHCGFTPREFEKWNMFIEHFADFLDSSKPYKKDVITCWIGEKPYVVQPDQSETIRPRQDGPVPPIQDEQTLEETLEEVTPRRISIQDDWESDVRDRLVRLIDLNLPAQQYPNLRVRIFGLSEQRGAVTFGYSVNPCQRLNEADFPAWREAFGVPYEVRMDNVGRDVVQGHLVSLVTAITTQERNRTQQSNSTEEFDNCWDSNTDGFGCAWRSVRNES